MPSLDWEKKAEELGKIVVKETPFVLIARVKVKPGEVENYLKIYEMLLTDKIFLKKFWDGINDTSGAVYPIRFLQY